MADCGGRQSPTGVPGDGGSRDRGEQQTREGREARGEATATGGGVGDEGEAEVAGEAEARRGGRGYRCRAGAAC